MDSVIRHHMISSNLLCRFHTFPNFNVKENDTFLFMNNGFELALPEVNLLSSIML